MLYRDNQGNIYDGLLKRILKIYSPSLSIFGGIMKKNRFTKKELCEEVGKIMYAGFSEGLKATVEKNKFDSLFCNERVDMEK